jgi:hypothetical protein
MLYSGTSYLRLNAFPKMGRQVEFVIHGKYRVTFLDPKTQIRFFSPYFDTHYTIILLFCNKFNKAASNKVILNTQIIKYVGLLISFWLFLFPIFPFAAQPKEFFLDRLKKLEQRSHKFVCGAQKGICRVNTFFQSRSLLFSL